MEFFFWCVFSTVRSQNGSFFSFLLWKAATIKVYSSIYLMSTRLGFFIAILVWVVTKCLGWLLSSETTRSFVRLWVITFTSILPHGIPRREQHLLMSVSSRSVQAIAAILRIFSHFVTTGIVLKGNCKASLVHHGEAVNVILSSSLSSKVYRKRGASYQSWRS